MKRCFDSCDIQREQNERQTQGLGDESMTVINQKMLYEVLKAGIEISFQIVKSSMLCSVKMCHGREKNIKRQTRDTVTLTEDGRSFVVRRERDSGSEGGLEIII